MQTSNQYLALPPNSSVLLHPGCSVLLRPASYEEGEPLVTYAIGAVIYSVPQRAVAGGRGGFLSRQIENDTRDVDKSDPGNLKVKLTDPVFRNPYLFSLILDHLNRTLDAPADTLRQTSLSLNAEQWAHLVELERFVFQRVDRNPFWTGLTGQDFRVSGNVTNTFIFRPPFSMEIVGGILRVHGPGGFSLLVNLISLTNPPSRPVSLLRGYQFGSYMEYPFPVNFKSSFFIPHEAIRCTIEEVPTVCEGVLQSNGHLRIEPINAAAFTWFSFEIAPRHMTFDSIVYGDGSDDDEEVGVDDLWVPFEGDEEIEDE
jgi:hypothetical protein